ncbi:TPA: hypothetical protein ACH3X1_004949 [Trebouxia sp. C0004]
MEDHGVSLDTIDGLKDLTRDQGEALVKRFMSNKRSASQDMCEPIHVYVLQNVANGRCYVSQAADLAVWFAQHRRKPPTRIKKDVQQYVPFDQFSVMSVLGVVFGKVAADRAEATHIATYAATGSKGYNTLRTASGSSRKYWFLQQNGPRLVMPILPCNNCNLASGPISASASLLCDSEAGVDTE